MDIPEKDLETMIHASLKTSSGIKQLRDRGFELGVLSSKPTLMWRQLNIGAYGVADLVILRRLCGKICIDLVELKKDKITIESLIQIIKYKTGICHYLQERGIDYYHIELHLIGTGIEKCKDSIFMFNEIRDLNVYEFSYEINGIFFKKNRLDYKYKNTRFNNG